MTRINVMEPTPMATPRLPSPEKPMPESSLILTALSEGFVGQQITASVVFKNVLSTSLQNVQLEISGKKLGVSEKPRILG